MVNISICDKLVEHASEMLCAVSSEGHFIKVNAACKRMLGYKPEELEGNHYAQFILPEDLAETQMVATAIQHGKKISSLENRYLRKDRQVAHLVWSINWSEEDAMFYCTAREVTENQNLHKRLNEKEAFYEALIEHGSDMLGLLDESGNYLFVSGATTRLLGYQPEELIGVNAFNLIHPDDLANTVGEWSKLEKQSIVQPSEFRFKHASGSWRWIETIVSNQLANPAIRAFVVSSRDVTDRKTGRLKLEESEQRYRALFDNNPDIVIFEDTNGTVTKVNKAFKETFGAHTEQFIGKPASAFLPPAMAEVNERSLQEALLGSTLRYDIELHTPLQQCRILDTVKFPVKVAGKVIGAQTVSKDITPIVRSFETIERQAKKLNTIFESITDAFFTLDTNWTYTYINSEFERITGAKELDFIGKHILEASPPASMVPFYEYYKHAVDTGETVHFEAYSERLGKWLEVKAFPSEEGLSVYFSDVTEKVNAKQEVEKLSLVASNTPNGVIISDRNRRIEWVNEGFTKLTGYSRQEVIGKVASDLLAHPETDKKAFDTIREKILSGSAVSCEILNKKKNGEKIWFSVQASPVYNKSGELTGYVTIQSDITERIATQKELEKLSLVANYTENAVVITDASGKVEWVNEGFTRMTGYTLPEVRAKKPGSILQGAETDPETIEQIKANLKAGIHFNAILINYRKYGEKYWVSMDITPIVNKEGAISQYIAIQKDISFRKETEENLLKLTQDLYLQNRNLQEFTYIVSHNLRAPVANALGLANLLTKTDRNTKVFEDSLAYLKTSVLKMDTVLRDVNSILSVKNSSDVLEMEDLRLADVFWQAYVQLQEPILLCGGEVTIGFPEDLQISANKSYLFSIFYNLLSNSIKFRSQDRVLQIRVDFLRDHARDVISFSDNGTGFDKEKVSDAVFKLYKRFHNNKKGRGMGLFLVKAHVEAMGWQIDVRSREKEGTTFLLYLS